MKEIHDITGQILRWPIPRPGLRKRLSRSLGILAWSSNELGDSIRRDQELAELDMAIEVDEILGDDAPAETALALVENGRLPGSDSPNGLIELDLNPVHGSVL